MATYLCSSKIKIKGSHPSIALGDHLLDIEGEINKIRDQLADIWLLADIEQTKSPYEMTYEEYMELPGYARL
jgi:hypothetical protein